MRALLTAALLLAVAAPALADSASSKKELTEDICSALQLATCGRAPYAVCHASDGIPDSELRARWARVDQLCRRYKDRYGEWLDNGCCDIVRRADPAERATRRDDWRRDWEARLCEMASHQPPNRATMHRECNEFDENFRSWPKCCADAQITRGPATRAQP